MNWTKWIGVAAVMAGLSVAIGAFAAHALKARVSPDLLVTFETGARYHMYHALAIGLVGLVASRLDHGLVQAAGWCFLAGILLFSGSLYALTLSGVRILGAVTPFGGLAFLSGWGLLAWSCLTA